MADTTGTSWLQIKSAERHGTQLYGQASDGTGASGNLAKFNADGSLTDAGVAATAAGRLVIGFVINTGAAGTNIGPMLAAPAAGSVSKCKVVTKASDASTALTFTIKQNGTAVFTSSPSVAAGTTSGTVSTFTGLTSSPLTVNADDVFSCDISSGTSSWVVTIQLET